VTTETFDHPPPPVSSMTGPDHQDATEDLLAHIRLGVCDAMIRVGRAVVEPRVATLSSTSVVD
jgi:hypothetical protein